MVGANQKTKKKDKILRVAFKLLYGKNKEKVTVDKIVEKAKIAKGTFYIYFRNKEDLILTLNIKALESVYEFLSSYVNKKSKAIDKIVTIGEAFSKFKEKNPEQFLILRENSDIFYKNRQSTNIDLWEKFLEVRKKMVYTARDILEQGKTEGSIKKDIDSLRVSLIIIKTIRMFAIHNMYEDIHLKDVYGVQPDSLIDCFFDIINNSIRSS